MSFLPRVIYFDLETTGYRGCNKYSTKHRIIQFAALESNANGDVFFCRYVQPEIPILPRSTSFHHITNEMVEHAPLLATVWSEFVETYQLKDKSRQIVLVAHNAHCFDRVVLIKELERLCIAFDGFSHVLVGDSLLYFRHLAPASLRDSIDQSTPSRSKYNLSNLYKFYTNSEIPNAHDAGADVSALANICQNAGIDWGSFPFLCALVPDSVVWFYPVPNEDVDVVALHGIGPARKNALKRSLRLQKLTIRTIRACIGVEPLTIETFLRTKAKFDDDALILELVAYVSRRNPLQLLSEGYPFCRGCWGKFKLLGTGVEDRLDREGIRTPQQLVEATLYDEDLKRKLLKVAGNDKAYDAHSYRL